ncbi:M56 family metallopeptidase [Echinicola soli]|uniref:M56 family metallopeptidase n=1 Tax=Echinicola soli TaxID=2591634 RepID=A0A514CJP7_9BACT|nr:M56 family metallopeptidase [Echinicola soli]QDH80061.1 M56 family metallopeptidase [Echinicola soli]
MIVYLIKSAFSLLVFYSAYHLFLSREKIYRFNRFYLIGSLVFSLLAPLFHSPFQSSPELKHLPVFAETSSLDPIEVEVPDQEPILADQSAIAPAISIDQMFIFIYGFCLVMFLSRFIRGIWSFCKRIKIRQIYNQDGIKVVMDTDKDTPFTFLNYVFVNAAEFRKNRLDARLFHHEIAHAKQWHSLDILFIELIKTIFWFNPILYFYKKSIQLNHEYLADESVNRHFGDIKGYQALLLSYAGHQQQNRFASYSKYSLTKNRLKMMCKTKNTTSIILKTLMAIPLALGLTVLFSMKPQTEKSKPVSQPPIITQQPVGAQNDHLEEYKKHYQRFQAIMDKNGSVDHREIDIDRMRQLWDLMSTEQRDKAPKLNSIPAPPVPDKKHPTNFQLKEWRNNPEYTVWVDRKRISKSQLKKYTKEDIAWWNYRRNYTKTTGGKHDLEIEVRLMTNNEFYWVYFLNKTGYDGISVYKKAIEIYNEHQKHPKKYAGQLGGKLSELQQVYSNIPQWKKEKYNIKPPSEVLANQ